MKGARCIEIHTRKQSPAAGFVDSAVCAATRTWSEHVHLYHRIHLVGNILYAFLIRGTLHRPVLVGRVEFVAQEGHSTIVTHHHVVVPRSEEAALSDVLLPCALSHRCVADALQKLVAAADVGVSVAPGIVGHRHRIHRTRGKHHTRGYLRRRTELGLIASHLQSTVRRHRVVSTEAVAVGIETDVGVDLRQKTRRIRTVGKDHLLVQVGDDRLVEIVAVARCQHGNCRRQQ